MCEVTDLFTATELTELLLKKYDIFIKDCTGKIGFENGNYIRIAVRDKKDNDFMLEKLKEVCEYSDKVKVIREIAAEKMINNK